MVKLAVIALSLLVPYKLDQSPAVVPTLLFELGTGSRGDADVFVQVRNVHLAADSSLWVVDDVGPNRAELRRFGARGEPLGTVARPGQGPGELRGVAGITSLPDGRVLVWDETQRRISVYQAAGRYDTTWLLPPEVRGAVGGNGLTADERSMVWVRTPLVSSRRGLHPSTGRAVWVRLDRTGRVVDTIVGPVPPSLPGDPRVAPVIRYLDPRSGALVSGRLIPRYAAQPGVLVSPAGHVLAWRGDQNRIQRWNLTSVSTAFTDLHREPARELTRSVPAVPISPEERDEIRTELMAHAKTPGSTVSASIPTVPSVKPLIRDVVASQSGAVAVLRSQESQRITPVEGSGRRFVERGLLFDLLEVDGRYRGTIRLPEASRLVAVRGNLLVALKRGADGEVLLQVFRIPRS